MSKSAHFEKMIFITILSIILSQQNPTFAHNTSWNKATITIKNNRVHLALSIMQVDLLGVVDPEKDSTISRSHQEWEDLLPKINEYSFKNVNLKINGRPVTDGIDETWRLENYYSPDDENNDSLMGVIEVARSWPIADSLIQLELKPNLLMNVDVPVKWVVIIPRDTFTKKPYQIITRGETASYNFNKHAWVDSLGVPLSDEDKSTLWGTMVQFIQGLFSCLVK